MAESSPEIYATDRRRGVSRSASTSSSYSSLEDSLDSPLEEVPIDRLSVLDILDNLALTTKINQFNQNVRRTGGEIKDMALRSRDRVLRGREEDIDRMKSQLLKKIDKWEAKWEDARLVSQREKIAFVYGLSIVFLGGLILGGAPDWFHVFYSVQMVYLMPIRIYSYRKRAYQYFLADLCYFVNMLLLIWLWLLPGSRRLFLSCYCLSYGTLAWAVITWRNSLVLHSVDKTTSTFIHVLPPVVLHCIHFRLDEDYKKERFGGAADLQKLILAEGMAWASFWYIIWQTLYHIFITVKRKDKIKAGHLTSFEWLRRSYKNTAIGKFVNSLPEPLPVFAFMLIQFGYQMLTMLPCPIWYSSKYLSAMFVFTIFMIAAYNGATYYIDVFGRRFQKELNKLQNDVSKWHNSSTPPSPELSPQSSTTVGADGKSADADVSAIALSATTSGLTSNSESDSPAVGASDAGEPKKEK
ncbi:hypothetical protein BZA70DRAFT_271100 [Myxozyma melibiosi]|uniref:Glycerophosphocholine acyltransferase 1 n=1 Tax=Myxozyma melibiosi TaxID=54550 RepID=A0ABR1FC77_9ASCO